MIRIIDRRGVGGEAFHLTSLLPFPNCAHPAHFIFLQECG
jgi:hypothetical protein